MLERARATELASLHRQGKGGGGWCGGPLERTCQTSLQEQRADEKEDISLSNICRDVPPLETAGVRLRAAGAPLQLGPLSRRALMGNGRRLIMPKLRAIVVCNLP